MRARRPIGLRSTAGEEERGDLGNWGGGYLGFRGCPAAGTREIMNMIAQCYVGPIGATLVNRVMGLDSEPRTPNDGTNMPSETLRRIRLALALVVLGAASSMLFSPSVLHGEEPCELGGPPGSGWYCIEWPHTYGGSCEGIDCYVEMEFCCRIRT